MAYTTDRRLFLLSTPLGEDVLLIRSLRGFEGVSLLFEFELDMLSERDDIEPDEIIGKRVTLRIETDIGERHFTGIVSRFSQKGRYHDPGADGQELSEYHCVVVPWLWPLALQEDSRVFQNLSIPDIIEKILGEFDLRDYELELRDAYPQLEYCTQYRETNLAFIARLLEQAGIHYYVKHGDQVETIVFTDHNDGHPSLENDEIRFAESRGTEEHDNISRLARRSLLRTGRITMRDHNFEIPDDVLEVTVDSLIQLGDNQNYQRYVYPGHYMVGADGDAVAKLQMEAEEAEHEILDGVGSVRALAAGHCFTLHSHPTDAFNREYMVLSVWHTGNNNVGRGAVSSHYDNRFTLIPRDVPFRPKKSIPKPIMYGPQTAVVTGPAGEQIHTDKYGRVKLQFFWDREGKVDEKSSCWVRVVMPHAGSRWGMFSLPRVGEEVLVAFEHGDPDRPIIVGGVYNANNMPPYELPAEKTKSTIKTNSYKGTGFNELRFEDKAGSEEVFLHAQKEMQARVGEDSIEWIGRDRHLVIENNQLEEVKGKRMATVTGDDLLDVKANHGVKAGSSVYLSASQDCHFKAGADAYLTSGMNQHFKGGVNLNLDAGVQISLKAGPSSITLGPAGVTIDGPLVRINCGGSASSASSAQAPDTPDKPKNAIEVDAGKASDPMQRIQAQALRRAAAQAQPFCAVCEAARRAQLAMGRGG